MKLSKTVLLIAISLISLSSFSQSLTSKTNEELEIMKKEAIKTDNFELAGKISEEQKSRVSIDELIKEHKENLKIAAAKEDFAEAERLQKEIDRLEEKKVTLAKLEEEKKAAIAVEDFEKVLSLEKQIADLKSDKKAEPVATQKTTNTATPLATAYTNQAPTNNITNVLASRINENNNSKKKTSAGLIVAAILVPIVAIILVVGLLEEGDYE